MQVHPEPTQTTPKPSGVTRVGITRGPNDGVTPIFFLPKTDELLVINSTVSLLFFRDFTRVSSPPGCHPGPFYLFDLVSPLFFVNSATIFFSFGCHPLEHGHSYHRALGARAPPSADYFETELPT